MEFSSSAIRIVMVLGARGRGGCLAKTAVAAIRGGGLEDGEYFERRQGNNGLDVIGLEGKKKKVGDEILLARRGCMDEEGVEDNKKTTAVVESNILKAGADPTANPK